ncbi:MAG: hypothetical protein KJO07_17505 [Deltaproteobacteria bacterium]|nr:hypothetical protein [Deltaproteobacteria bacterium]
MSEYDPIPPRTPLSSEPTDLERAQTLFAQASVGYLRSPWSWWAWGLLLPAAALLTREVFPIAGPLPTLALWSVVILVGGVVEASLILGGRSLTERTPLGGWVLRTQGNLSLVAVALSAVLFWQSLPQFLPAVWLLLVGHSFYVVGRLSFKPLQTAGIILQLGGTAALVPMLDGLVAFAASFFAACAWVGWGVHRRTARTAAA